MEFFRNTSFDFMRARRVCLTLSAVAVIAALGYIFSRQLNLGIDFAGGTQMIVQFDEPPDVQELRGLLQEAGIENASIQAFGEEGDNSIILKTPVADDEEQRSSASRVEEVLERRYNSDVSGFDLNRQGTEALASMLLGADPDGMRATGDDIGAREHYREAAAEVMALRRTGGLIRDWSEIQPGEALSPEALAVITDGATFGHFAVQSSDSVLPQIGGELRRKGLLAIAFSLAGILTYIWFRFELRFGIGALVALAHDVAICLGLFAFAGYEFNLTTVAVIRGFSFLLLVGVLVGTYSSIYVASPIVLIWETTFGRARREKRAAAA